MFIPSIFKSAPVRYTNTGLSAGIVSTNVTISSVNVNYTMLQLLGISVDNADSASGFAYITLTSATNVNITRAGFSGNMTVTFEVREYIPGFMKQPVQRGLITLTAVASQTQAVTATSARTTLNHLGNTTTDGASGNASRWFIRLEETSNVLITAFNDGPLFHQQIVSWELADWR